MWKKPSAHHFMRYWPWSMDVADDALKCNVKNGSRPCCWGKTRLLTVRMPTALRPMTRTKIWRANFTSVERNLDFGLGNMAAAAAIATFYSRRSIYRVLTAHTGSGNSAYPHLSSIRSYSNFHDPPCSKRGDTVDLYGSFLRKQGKNSRKLKGFFARENFCQMATRHH